MILISIREMAKREKENQTPSLTEVTGAEEEAVVNIEGEEFVEGVEEDL